MRGLNTRDAGQYPHASDIDFASGCALLCRRAVLEQAGLLDERFFMYYEDAEWCVRIRKAGFRIVHVPTARVIHKIPLDARSDAPYVTYYMARNRLLFLSATRAALPAWLSAAFLQDLRTAVSWSLRPKWRKKRAQRDALLRAWWDFCGRRFGRRNNR
jgi:GT2 family glycosyltransferase